MEIKPDKDSSEILKLGPGWNQSLSFGILIFAALIYLWNVYNYQLKQWDDGYITFRFAQHLAAGQGLVWNIGGERVEGYTSFLHVLLLALGIKAGITPQVGSILIGILSVFGTAGIMFRVLKRMFGTVHPAAAVILGLYLIDMTTAIHTTSGLETQLFVLLLCITYYIGFIFLISASWQISICLSIAVFLSALSRPEGVLYAAGVYGVLGLYSIYITRRGEGNKSLKLLILSIIFTAFLGLVYAIWKYSYFGYLLPNPFYVKSNRLALDGWGPVSDFLMHFGKWYLPLVLGFGLLAYWDQLVKSGKNVKTAAWILLTLTPPFLALAYYSTIIHEVGGAYRFSYPTYFYLVLAVAAFVSAAQRYRLSAAVLARGAAIASLVYFMVPLNIQDTFQKGPLTRDGFIQTHFKIANVLEETGLGSNGTVICDAAGIIPYVSGFNQIDRVGLVDNYLSGRIKLSPLEREEYIWRRSADVYVGYEPPAAIGAQSAEQDPRMNTPYVKEILLGPDHREGIGTRMFLKDRELLHYRMSELRDHWDWVGEVKWPGFKAWGLKLFVYVRRESAYHDILVNGFKKIISIQPNEVNLDVIR